MKAFFGSTAVLAPVSRTAVPSYLIAERIQLEIKQPGSFVKTGCLGLIAQQASEQEWGRPAYSLILGG